MNSPASGRDVVQRPESGAGGDGSPAVTDRATPVEDVPSVGTAVEEGIAAVAMALVCIITFANVLVRYLTNASFAFTEEFSIFLLVVMTFAGTSAAFARDRHIRMEYFVHKLRAANRRRAEILVILAGLALFVVLAFYGTRLFYDDFEFGTTSPGIGIPQWIYTVWLPILFAVIALRLFGRLVRLVRGSSP